MGNLSDLLKFFRNETGVILIIDNLKGKESYYFTYENISEIDENLLDLKVTISEIFENKIRIRAEF